MQDTLIIIPTYNEQHSISEVVESLKKLQAADILVINDGSSDLSAQQAASSGVSVISHSCNLGYGAALQTGYRVATNFRYQYVIQFDADGQHSPADIMIILDQLRLGHADVVLGSRFHDGEEFSPGILKFIAVLFFRFIIRSVTGKQISDPTSGMRGLTRSAFVYYAQPGKVPNDFPDADLIIDMLLHGYRIAEVPISNRKRALGKSMHNGISVLVYVPKVMLHIVRILCLYGFKKLSMHSE